VKEGNVKTSKRYITLVAVIVLLLFAVSAFFYPQLPDKLASHWNAAGQADGYSSKFWGLFMLPIIAAVLTLFLLLIPRLDPLKANIEKFKGYYYGFIIVFLLFFFYLHLLTIVYNLGYAFNMTMFLMPAFSVLFYYMGVMVSKAKRNYFIGIRTPWTLNSDTIWDKTHKLGGKLFKIAAIITLLGVLLGQYAIWFMLVPVSLVAIITVVYSYLVFRKEAKTNAPVQP
jgi:uncharacterized membrane protein